MRIVADGGKSVLIIISCGNAADDSEPLLLVCDGKNLWDVWCLGRLDLFCYAVTENGWIEWAGTLSSS
uniref:Uncharacterized protein n=1 Tax=Romanomermis culicivorax TaxID=13658 RepID=A0A915JDI5_ROMCU